VLNYAQGQVLTFIYNLLQATILQP